MNNSQPQPACSLDGSSSRKCWTTNATQFFNFTFNGKIKLMRCDDFDDGKCCKISLLSASRRRHYFSAKNATSVRGSKDDFDWIEAAGRTKLELFCRPSDARNLRSPTRLPRCKLDHRISRFKSKCIMTRRKIAGEPSRRVCVRWKCLKIQEVARRETEKCTFGDNRPASSMIENED